MTIALTALAVEDDVKNTDNVTTESETVDSQVENDSNATLADEKDEADIPAAVQKENKTEKSDDSWKWVILIVAVAAIGYSVYKRKIAPTVITFDSLVDYAELAKNSGAASVNAFRLGSMPDAQRQQVMTQYKLGFKYKYKGYKPESTLIVVQMDDEGKVLDQIILCGHKFDEKLSIAFTNNTVLTISLK